MTKSSMSGMINLGEDFKKAVEAMDKIPPYVLVPLYDAYFKGSLTVLEVFAAGGWEAVKELYANPPDSTEQTLHPVEKLVRKRDLPRRFEPPTLKALASWKRLHSDVLGELSWRVYFWNWGRKDAPELAAGWDGDRWTVWADGDKTAGVVQTVWDSPAEAAQFADAYQATVATRGVKALVKPDGDRVTIVLGCDVIDCAAVMKDVEKAKPK
jgi:hypothetical protein